MGIEMGRWTCGMQRSRLLRLSLIKGYCLYGHSRTDGSLLTEWMKNMEESMLVLRRVAGRAGSSAVRLARSPSVARTRGG